VTVAGYVAGGHHLLAEEVEAGVGGDDAHALWLVAKTELL
jgi:hypothetical protein